MKNYLVVLLLFGITGCLWKDSQKEKSLADCKMEAMKNFDSKYERFEYTQHCMISKNYQWKAAGCTDLKMEGIDCYK